MVGFKQRASWVLLCAAMAALALILPPMASAQGLRILGVSALSNQLFEFDVPARLTVSNTPITLAGFTVVGCSGLAVQPGTGIVFALLQTNLDATVPRRLVTLDPGTGVATDIGPADNGSGLTFADITFTSGGTLFGITGDDLNFPGPSPETLFTINTGTAVPTLVTALGNGSEGEAIAFNPGDGLIYHLSGANFLNDPVNGKILETIDPAAPLNPPVNVPLSSQFNFDSTRPRNLAFWGNGLFLADTGFVVSSSGQVLEAFNAGLVEWAVIGSPADCTAAGRICGAAFDPDGPVVLYSISQADGSAQMIGPIGFLNVSGIDFNAAGTLFGTGLRMDGSNTPVLITIDPATGAGTEIGIGTTGLPGGATDISFRPSDGTLFGLAVDPGTVPPTLSLATWNTTTAAGTVIAPITGTTPLSGNAFAFDAADTAFYLNQNELDTLNTNTAVATVVAPATYSFPLDNNPLVTAMDFDPTSGVLFGAALDGDTQLVTIDTTTGIVTNVGATQVGLQAIAIRLGVATTGANLAVTKTDLPDPIILGSGDITYTVTVTNNGPDPATNVSLSDSFTFGGGAAATFVSATPSQGTCTPAFPAVPCDLGTINSGANATVAIVVTPTAAGTVTNTASATATETDPNPANNTNIVQDTTVTTLTADLVVTKTDSPDPALVSTNITYTVTVTNNGPDGATSVTLTDVIDAGTPFVSALPSQGTCDTSGLPTISCALGNLANAASATVTLVVTAPASSGTVTNNASVTGAEGDTNLANNTASASTTVNTVQADVSVTKTDSPDPQGVGGNITYTVVVSNAGPDAATNVALTDTLSGTATTFVSVTSAGNTCNSAGFPTITCTMGTIASGASETAIIVVTGTAAGTVTNTASITATEPDPNAANNTGSASTTVQAAGFTLAVTPANITILPGQAATFTVTITPTPFVATVDLTGSGTPPLGSLTFGSTTLNPGNTVASTTMVVGSDGFFVVQHRGPQQSAPVYAYWLPISSFGVAGVLLIGRDRKRFRGRRRAVFVAVLSLVILTSLIAGCAFGRNREDEGTPGGTYPITVTATGGGVTQTATVNVVVQGTN